MLAFKHYWNTFCYVKEQTSGLFYIAFKQYDDTLLYVDASEYVIIKTPELCEFVWLLNNISMH